MSRLLFICLLQITAVVFLTVLVALKRVANRKQVYAEKPIAAEVCRECLFPVGQKPAVGNATTAVRHPPVPLPNESRAQLRKSVPSGNGCEQEARSLASEKNQVMDELLARPDIPSDYGAEMVALYRDRTQDVYTRDFAVQHIGLYAETLNRRGTYDPASREVGELRRALWDASDETGTIIAAAAFRALADLAAFDPKVDARRLDTRLVSCAGDGRPALRRTRDRRVPSIAHATPF